MNRNEFIILLHSCISPSGANWHADAARFLFVTPQTIGYALKHNPSTALADTLLRSYNLQSERRKLCKWAHTVRKRRPMEATVVHGHAPRFMVREVLEAVSVLDVSGTRRVVHRRADLEWYWLDPAPEDLLECALLQGEAVRIMDEGLDDQAADQRLARCLTKKQRADLMTVRRNASLIRLGLMRTDGFALTVRGAAVRDLL